MASNFPARLTYLRERARLSKAALARAVGISPAGARAWEVGRNLPTWEHVPALCRALGCTPNDLFGWEEGLEGYAA